MGLSELICDYHNYKWQFWIPTFAGIYCFCLCWYFLFVLCVSYLEFVVSSSPLSTCAIWDFTLKRSSLVAFILYNRWDLVLPCMCNAHIVPYLTTDSPFKMTSLSFIMSLLSGQCNVPNWSPDVSLRSLLVWKSKMLQWKETATICSHQKHHPTLSMWNMRQTEGCFNKQACLSPSSRCPERQRKGKKCLC